MNRIVTSAVVTVMSAVALGACSSQEATSEPDPEISIDGGPGTFTPEEQEVVDAVEGYFEAFLTRGETGVAAALDGRLTDQLAADLVPAEKKLVDDADLWYIGEPLLDPEGVTIDGDAATFTGCQDAAEVFLVPVGEETAGVGSKSLGYSDLTVELVREDGRWLIDTPRRKDADAC